MGNLRFFILLSVNTIAMNGFTQEWEPINEFEEFPELDYVETSQNKHLSWEAYRKRAHIRHEKAIEKFAFKEFHFDTELGDHKKEFSEIIDSVITLLPSEIKVDSIARYLNPKNGKWTVDVEIKEKTYSFSTYPSDGDYMDLESFWSNFEAILNDHEPEYKMVSIDDGQAMGLLIQKKEDLLLASQEGFEYSLMVPDWVKYRKELYGLYLRSFSEINEAQLSKSFVEEFNRISEKTASKKRISIDNFWICDIEDSGLLLMLDNNIEVGTPEKNKQQMRCSPTWAQYLFAYCLVKESGSKVYLEDKRNNRRKETSLQEIENLMIESMLQK